MMNGSTRILVRLWSKRPKKRWVEIAAGAFAALVLFITLDLVLPPDMGRYKDRSVEVRAEDNHLLRAYLSNDDKWRLIATPANVDPRYLTFLKAVEDKRFDSHWGVDPLAVFRAAGQWLSAGHIISGASTLSMQAARLLEPRPRGLGAKALQAMRSLQLERRYNKSEILSVYLTLAPFGGNLEGVRAASLAYFGKEPTRLTAAEAALLVAMPQSPERMRPDRFPARARAGRDKVLHRLADESVIDQATLKEALAAPIPISRARLPMHAPHLADGLFAQAKPAEIIKTPIDYERQKQIEMLGAQEQNWFPDGASMATIVVENRTRQVRAYVGGLDYWGQAGQVDLARAVRSPGSALKPFIYALAFDELPLHPETIMLDEPLIFGDYAPQNFDHGFQGMVSVRKALQMSLNIPAVAVLDKLGPVRVAELLKRGGAKLSFRETHELPGLPMALGGVGINLHDLTQLYAALANQGVSRPLVMKLGEKQPFEQRLISRRAAWYIEDILRGSPMPDGWGRGQQVHRPRKIAFKTGTSYGYRDQWAVGYSQAYTVAVWVGRADGSARMQEIGRNTAAPIVFKIFDLLPAEMETPDAPPPEAVTVSDNVLLPEAMQRFYANPQKPPGNVSMRTSAPQIAYPPNGATLQLGNKPADRLVELRATGGQQPLRWIVNGQLLPPTEFLSSAYWTAQGPGFVKFVVIDAAGRAAAARVRIKFDG
ncbi:MAG: penicillin-binding protein 1C [Alphaproteobacteria bacterium]